MESGLQVKIEKIWSASQRRTDDIIIMDYVQKHIPRWMWIGINNCRLYLQAIALSDLTNIEGTHILPGNYQVTERQRTSRLDFPLQDKPNESDINCWQYLIRYVTADTSKLRIPLGRWTETPYQYYPYVLDTQSQLVYQKHGLNNWEVYHKTEGTRNKYEISLLKKIDFQVCGYQSELLNTPIEN